MDTTKDEASCMMDQSESLGFLADKDNEAKAWPSVSMTTSASLSFWTDFLGLRMGPKADQLNTSKYLAVEALS